VRVYLQQIEIARFGSIVELKLGKLSSGLNTRPANASIDYDDLPLAIGWALSGDAIFENEKMYFRALPEPGTRVRLTYVSVREGADSKEPLQISVERRVKPGGASEFWHGNVLCDAPTFRTAVRFITQASAVPLVINEPDLQRIVSGNAKRCRRALDRYIGYANYSRNLIVTKARLVKASQSLQRISRMRDLLQKELELKELQVKLTLLQNDIEKILDAKFAKRIDAFDNNIFRFKAKPSLAALLTSLKIRLAGQGFVDRVVFAEFEHIAVMHANMTNQMNELVSLIAELKATVETLKERNDEAFSVSLGEYEDHLRKVTGIFLRDSILRFKFDKPKEMLTSGATVTVQTEQKPTIEAGSLQHEERMLIAVVLRFAAHYSQGSPITGLSRPATVVRFAGEISYRRLLEIMAEQQQVILFKSAL
jgi:chromosome segregation ATPase